MEPLLSLKHVSKTFPVGKTILGKPDKFVHAVNDVSFDVYKGETFSIVGESGCGKSTTGRLINHLLTPDSGEIKFMGQEISHLTQDQMRPLRKDVQMIFQDPAGSLKPAYARGRPHRRAAPDPYRYEQSRADGSCS